MLAQGISSTAQVIMGTYAVANLACVVLAVWQDRGMAPFLRCRWQLSKAMASSSFT